MKQTQTDGAVCIEDSAISGPVDADRMNQVRKPRVGIVLQSSNWLGGRNYFRNLVAALQSLPDGRVTPILFTGTREKGVSTQFPGTTIVRSSLLDHKSISWLVRKIIAHITKRDILLQRLFTANQISVLSHSGPLRGQSSIATIGWLGDFQHLHLPECFTFEERMRIDRDFKMYCVYCDKLVVSSKSVLADVVSFSPEHVHKVELLRFVASPALAQTAASLVELSSLYRIDRPFFLLPNQFWAHKNHAVVIHALHLLKQQGKHVTVLATGMTHDYRNPEFFYELMRLASQCGVTESFRVLGAIPLNHLAGLMRESVAFINPSLFEGWSTSVEEAKSMGKTILLSDIPVHREQAPERGLFFDPGAPSALAACMQLALAQFDPVYDKAMQDCAEAVFVQRQRAFGELYAEIIIAAIRELRQRMGVQESSRAS